MKNIHISIANDFSDAPGGRYRKDGKYSGEEFRDDYIVPKLETLKDDEVITIDLDGCYGFPVSFLEETFGGLSRRYGSEKVLSKIKCTCTEAPEKVQEILSYIKDCK